MNLYFDNNVLPDMIRADINPVAALAGSDFVLSITPDLAEEYRQAIAHERVPRAEKELCQALLLASTERGIFGFAEAGPAYSGFGHGMWATEEMVETIRLTNITVRPDKDIPKNRTDSFLAALSQDAVVITNDTGGHYKRAKAAGKHVYSWSEVYDVENASSEIVRKLNKLLKGLT